RPAVSLAELAEGGTILGILPESHYAVGDAWMQPGCVLTVFSDGVTEAQAPDGEQFQVRRVRAVLQKAGDRPAATIVQHWVAAVERFTGGTDPADDLSVAIIRRAPHPRTRDA